jgi:hypothetical protein
VPRVIIKTGVVAEDGREVELAEYVCDTPDCPNVATHVLGCIREFGLSHVVCDEHAAAIGRTNTRIKAPRVPPPDGA